MHGVITKCCEVDKEVLAKIVCFVLSRIHLAKAEKHMEFGSFVYFSPGSCIKA